MKLSRLARRRSSGGALLFTFLFFGYLLSSSKEIPRGDARAVYEVAESIVARGAVDISTVWNISLRSRDGKVYAASPLLQSVVHVPAQAVRHALAKRWPKVSQAGWALFSNVGPALLGALTGLLFFRLLERLGASARMALGTTLISALATSVWVYSRTPFAEILQAACFMGYFAAVVDVHRTPSKLGAASLGMWAGLLVNSKFIFVTALPGAALFLIWSLRRRPRDLAVYALCFLGPFLALLAVVFLYNYWRWGGMTQHGYDLGGSVFRANVLHGLWALFLSPNKSVLLYSPPLLLGLAAMPRFAKRHTDIAVAALFTTGPVIVAYARFIHWFGDWAWGPRYLVFALPMFLIPWAMHGDEMVAAATRGGREIKRSVVMAVIGWGVFVQLMGNAFCWDHDYAFVRRVRPQWLGTGNNRTSHTQGAFEEWYPLHWLIPFNPINLHWWLLKHKAQGHDWKTANEDPPWRRYTALPIPIDVIYERVGIDWWYLPLRKETPRFANGSFVVLGLGFAASTAGLVWSRRRRRDDGPVPLGRTATA